MSRVLPILFNTDMVRAILDGRKTVTRRLVKVPPYYPHFYKLHDNTDGALSGTMDRLYAGFYKDEQIFYIDGEKHVDGVYYQAPYQPGDILYVRETWNTYCEGCASKNLESVLGATCSHACGENGNGYYYKATDKNHVRWRPSIHMPKEAARIWLKVTDVRVERLQECGKCWCLDIEKEGIVTPQNPILYINDDAFHDALREEFQKLWNSTIKKSDLDRYGWDANPWVWVIEFERCEKPDVRCE